MALKDFSFAQLDKKARLSVGTVEKKSDRDDLPHAKNYCSHNRTCSAYRR